MPGPGSNLIAAYFRNEIASDLVRSSVTVGTTAIALAQYSERRVKLRLCNFGGANVVLGRDFAVTATTGIQLSPGQTVEFDWQDDQQEVARQLVAISAIAGNVVEVVETLLLTSHDGAVV